MVRLSLSIKAETEEIQNIYPSDHKIWFFKLKCSNCMNVDDKWIGIDPSEKIEVVRTTVNLLMKCKQCARENSILIEDKIPSLQEREIESETFIEMARFDCRGVELEEFDCRDHWNVVSTSGKVYNNVDLTEGEWSEYDDRNSASLSILNIESKITKFK